MKFVRRPFIAERTEFMRANSMIAAPVEQWMAIRWDGQPQRAWSSIQTADYVNPVMRHCVGLKPHQWADPGGYLDLETDGDWVFRADAPVEDKLRVATSVLFRENGHLLTFKRSKLPREVVVVRGRYVSRQNGAPRAEGGENRVVSSDQAVMEPFNRQQYTERGTLSRFLESLEWQTGLAFVDDSESSGVPVTWQPRLNGKPDLARLLSNLEAQTSLRFERQTRSMETWVLVNADGSTPSPDWWVSRFNQVYGLEPGETLKLVPPPFIPERAVFAARGAGREHGPQHLQRSQTLTLLWSGGAARWHEVKGPGTLNDLPRGLLNLQPWEIDESIPRDLPMPGDWVVREGATAAQVMTALSTPVSKTLGRPVHFEQRRMTREVILVHGTPAFKSLDGTPGEVVGLTDGTLPPSAGWRSPPPMHGTVAELLRVLSVRAGRQVVDKTSAPRTPITWRDPGYCNDREALLRNVARQTSLHFERQPKEQAVWVMVEGR
jgi:hypothetical protein